LGRVFHTAPNVLHYGKPGTGLTLEEGMFFTIEPMINLGGPQMQFASDGWTAVARDGKPSAHFEHTVLVTDNGPEILTLAKI